MQLIENVLANYRESSAAKVAGKTGSMDQQAILVDLPDFFRRVLAQKRKLTDFKIEGSIGNGNIAHVPWVGVFNRSITTPAQNGFYVVLLFAQDMQSCTLSLNQGVTDIIQRYPQTMAKVKVREYAARAAQCFSPAPGAILGPIDLAANGSLGKSYEAAAIESFRYESNALPSAQIVAQHLEQLLDHYERLIEVAGTSLESLVRVTEQEYQQAAQKAAVQSSQKKVLTSPQDIPKEKPAPIQTSVGKIYPRDPKVAGEALAAAQHCCEVDSQHPTFVSYAKKRPYIEAHHLVPLALQEQFSKSLDVVANIVGLCPHCHKLLHLGQPQDKKPLLSKLFIERSQRLAKVGILIDRATLMQHYKMELFEDVL